MGDLNANVGGQRHTSERRQDALVWASEMNVEWATSKEVQDHEHTISEDSREEMDMEKP